MEKGDKEFHEEQYPWNIHLANIIVIFMVPNDEIVCWWSFYFFPMLAITQIAELILMLSFSYIFVFHWRFCSLLHTSIHFSLNQFSKLFTELMVCFSAKVIRITSFWVRRFLSQTLYYWKWYVSFLHSLFFHQLNFKLSK